MSLQQVEVEVEGMTALLMHRYPMEPIEALQNKPAREQAELAAYRDVASGGLYVPGVAVQRGLVAGAAYSKGKGRSSLQKPAAACLLVTPERLMLGTDEYEIDSRRVVVPATRGAVVRHRPRVDKWQLIFTLDYDSVLLSAEQIRQIVDDTGLRVGLLDFRPEKKGPFGRFKVIHWTPAD